MINKLYTVESYSTNPYYNLALEKYLLDRVGDGEMILYLWQNRRTVVCGKNQNVHKECRVSRLLEDGGFPARRLSGGGAVFHDMGNLNFTFLVKDADYNVGRQLSVITEACRILGIGAEKTGRNDITVEGRKFSGNAFHSSNGQRYHHGTIMINVDKDTLAEYLNVDKAKLATKGVESVRSRVANLIEYNPGISVPLMKDTMWTAFETEYGLKSERMNVPEDGELRLLSALYSSDEWLYGAVGEFKMQISRRFDWGDFDLRVNTDGSHISEAALYSDANDAEYIRLLAASLKGAEFNAAQLGSLAGSLAETEEQRHMAEDIKVLLFEQI
jgi:lipoate---protein ligase